MSLRLAILIPTLPERKEKFNSLVAVLKNQVFACGYEWGKDIAMLSDDTAKGLMTIGEKRNKLMFSESFTADYGAFIDDDDRIAPYYIKHIMEGIEKGVDACSLRGIITSDGQNPELFEHSMRYTEWKTNTTGGIKYFRPNNHLNAIKREIMQRFPFKEISHGEDRIWSEAIQVSGLIKTEHYIDEVIYHYDFIPNK